MYSYVVIEMCCLCQVLIPSWRQPSKMSVSSASPTIFGNFTMTNSTMNNTDTATAPARVRTFLEDNLDQMYMILMGLLIQRKYPQIYLH